ncbi:Uncharacterised protein [BD1-7 clade bacterium]|nr:Uncharacterised protein [BD1-7 clade bacterium]
MKLNFFLSLMILLSTGQAFSEEHFVRLDGGNWNQCDGKTNVAYSSEITTRECAVSHLFELLDPQTGDVRINGGDIITVMNQSNGEPAEYTMGTHGDYTSGRCHTGWAYSCTLPSLPSGTQENPTILRGQLVDGTCANKPVLWGTGRAKSILTIDNAEHVQISCLTITDKSSCVGSPGFPDQSLVCDRSAPYDKPFADTGITIKDSSNLELTDVDVQGLGKGIHAGRLHNITLTRVNIFANYSVGWDGDIGFLDGTPDSSNTGTVKFIDSGINFNGCALIYQPGSAQHNQPHACSRQDIGGYGDGVGTGQTGGDWIFDNTTVMHNSSDGLDMLYHEFGGKITIKNSRLEGNAGNQIKTSGNAEIINNIIIGSCAWNSRQEDALGKEGEICRAGGNTLSLHFTHADTQVSVINNTVYAEGDVIINTGNRTSVPESTQSLYVVNNVFYGLVDYRQNFENAAMYYTVAAFPYTQMHNNIIHKPKNFGYPCINFPNNTPSANNGQEGFCTDSGAVSYYDNDDLSIISNPHFPAIDIGHRYTAYDIATLKREAANPYPLDAGSPVVNNGYNAPVGGIAIPTTDFYGNPRVGLPDIGAIEYASKPNPPTILSIEQF